MIKKLKGTIFIMLLIVFIIIFVMNTFRVMVTFPSAQCMDEYKEFYFYKKDIIVKPFLDFGEGGAFPAAKIWFLPGQKNKLLNKIKVDVYSEISQIAEENNDIIKDFKISDDFKKIYIYGYIGSTNSSHFNSLWEELTERIRYKVEVYFQILDGYGNTNYDGAILNYVEEINTELTGVLSKQYGFYLSDETELIDAEYKVFAERNPYIKVIVDVSGDDIRDVFDEKMWDQNNIESSIKGDIGVETSVDWIYNNESIEYYYAKLCITKIKADLYRACFYGYGVYAQYFVK